MQIIINPVTGGENFLLDTDASQDVAAVRQNIATRLGKSTADVKLVCEGLELADGATLAEYFVQPLSTIRVVIAAGHGASGILSAPAGAAGGEDESQVISDGEMARAVVITGMPEAEPAVTERAVYDVFARYGDISRLIFQGDGRGAQHAVLVYHREPSAAAALAASGALVLGQPVNVMLAYNLAGPRPGGAAGGVNPRPSHASDVVADFLAKGVLFGVQGVAHVRRFDEANGVSHRVSVVASEGLTVASKGLEQASAAVQSVDRKYKVRETLGGTYELARSQAQELDSKYKLTEKAKQTAAAALAQANALKAKAMANPQVASAVTQASAFFSSATAMAMGAMAQAKADIHHIGTRLDTAASSAMPVTSASSVGNGASSGPSLPPGTAPAAINAPHAGQTVTTLGDAPVAAAAEPAAAVPSHESEDAAVAI